MIQGKNKTDLWKMVSGTEQAITVQMLQAGDILNVTAGFGKWSDKIAAGVMGAYFFAPLALSAIIGASAQRKLPSEIFDYIEKFILSGGQSAAVAFSCGKMLTGDEVLCEKCNGVNAKEQKFCQFCGEQLLKECSSCHHFVSGTSKFCPECGTEL